MCRGFAASSDRIPNFAHQIGKVLFDDEGAGPETLLQVALGERLGTVRRQDAKQLERLRREAHDLAAAQQLPALRIETVGREMETHDDQSLGRTPT
jgi:hypothetical protein